MSNQGQFRSTMCHIKVNSEALCVISRSIQKHYVSYLYHGVQVLFLILLRLSDGVNETYMLEYLFFVVTVSLMQW